MKKTVYTLIVNDYAPNLTALTLPLMKRWANKIGADFHVIKDRKFPEMPPVYEKFQIKELSKQHGNDWNIFWDADTLIHPDFWDVTEVIGKDTTVSNGTDFVPVRWVPDKYFRRDGRFIGKGNWCLIASDWCTDIWNPLEDMTLDEVAKRIHPTVAESSTVVSPEHLVDDFTVSRNIARYGLKHVLIPELVEKWKVRPGCLWHDYVITIDQKEFMMKKQLMLWVAEALARCDSMAQNTLNVISTLDWERDGKKDWADILLVVPRGDAIAKTIRSWGIDLPKKTLNEMSVEMKKDVMISAIATLPETREKQISVTNIHNWNGTPNWKQFISVLPLGSVIVEYVKNHLKFDIEHKPFGSVKKAVKK